MIYLKALALAVLIYLIWAIIYHKKDKSLTFEVLVEYLLTAVLVLVLLMGVQF